MKYLLTLLVAVGIMGGMVMAQPEEPTTGACKDNGQTQVCDYD